MDVGEGGWCKEVEEEVYKVVDGYEANAMMMMVIEVTNALCVFEKRGPKMFNFELLFLHRFSSKNREILHKAVLTPQ